MALFRGAPPVQDRPPPQHHIAKVLSLPSDDAQAERALNEILTDAHGAGYGLGTMALVGPGRLVLTFAEPVPVWRAPVPGDAAYEHQEGMAHDAAAYLSMLVTSHLPKEDPTAPPDPDDPDYEPQEVAPTDAETQQIAATHTSDAGAEDEIDIVLAQPVAPPMTAAVDND